MNDLITIVVPVYNVEKYLPHTLESICGQTYTNLQILLIVLQFVINGHDRITEFRFMSRKIKVLQGQEIKEYNWQQENM